MKDAGEMNHQTPTKTRVFSELRLITCEEWRDLSRNSAE